MVGRFITVEGGEGVGKSSFVRALAKRVAPLLDLPPLQTYEPGGTLVADKLRAVFVDPPASEPLFVEAELLTVMAARAQHVRHLIQPAVCAGKWVICDRFSDSSLVYQSLLGGLDRDTVTTIDHFATGGFRPDLTFVLDCPVEVSLQRLGDRRAGGARDSRFDRQQQSFHESVRQGFLELAGSDPQRYATIHVDGPLENAVAQAMRHLSGTRGFLRV